VPPLRVRPSDIPDLAAYFLRQYCLEHRSRPIVPTSEALRTLETSPFPGNIKELQAVLERAAGNMQDDETQLTADVLWDTTKVRILV
jgi:transcriptional regulator with AAA-type ATPase domain